MSEGYAVCRAIDAGDFELARLLEDLLGATLREEARHLGQLQQFVDARDQPDEDTRVARKPDHDREVLDRVERPGRRDEVGDL